MKKGLVEDELLIRVLGLADFEEVLIFDELLAPSITAGYFLPDFVMETDCSVILFLAGVADILRFEAEILGVGVEVGIFGDGVDVGVLAGVGVLVGVGVLEGVGCFVGVGVLVGIGVLLGEGVGDGNGDDVLFVEPLVVSLKITQVSLPSVSRP